MASITGAFLEYLAADLPVRERRTALTAALREPSAFRISLAVLRRELPEPVRDILDAPPSSEPFSATIDRLRSGDFSASFPTPEALGISAATPPGAEWVAVGVPTFTAEELDAFLSNWQRATADDSFGDDSFSAELRSGAWWEALETVYGTWVLLPQDRFPGVTTALTVMVGYEDRVVFDRIRFALDRIGFRSLSPLDDFGFRSDARRPGGLRERCALQAEKQQPNRPYVGSCENRGCEDGCSDLTGTGSGGHKVLLACDC